MEINLLPNDIDKLIKDTILKSALGKNIQQTIDKAMSDCLDRYDSPVKKMVQEVVESIVKEHFSKEENRKNIYDAIVKYLTPELIDKMMLYGINKLKEYVKEYN